MKKKKSSKPLNPFSISNAPKVPKASNGSNLLSAIAKSAKSEDIEKMPMVNEKKRKNQTSHLQFSKKKEAKSKDESTSKNALIAEKENFVKSVKSVSAFFSSVKTLSPAKETPIEEAVETQPDEQEVE